MKMSDIYDELQLAFAGQDELKKILVKKLFIQMTNFLTEEKNPVRQLLMLVGDTGSGKTYCLEQTAKQLDIPFYRIDCTSVSQGGGWAGISIEEELGTYFNIYKDHKFKDYGIILLDEFDKLGHPQTSSGGGQVNISIQHRFLDVIEGKALSHEKGWPPAVEKLEIDNLMFILSGSFQAYRDSLKEVKQKIGFTTQKDAEVLDPLEQGKKFMKEAGIIKEIIGRIESVYFMKNLNREELINAIDGESAHTFQKYVKFFIKHDLNFFLTKEQRESILHTAATSEFGLRVITDEINKIAMKFLEENCAEKSLLNLDNKDKKEDTKTMKSKKTD